MKMKCTSDERGAQIKDIPLPTMVVFHLYTYECYSQYNNKSLIRIWKVYIGGVVNLKKQDSLMTCFSYISCLAILIMPFKINLINLGC